jgi:hypothetical protein
MDSVTMLLEVAVAITEVVAVAATTPATTVVGAGDRHWFPAAERPSQAVVPRRAATPIPTIRVESVSAVRVVVLVATAW